MFRLLYYTRLILRDAALQNPKPKRLCRVVPSSPLRMIPRLVRKDVDMISKSCSLLLAAGLMVAPMATALAQSNNPAGNLGSNNSASATPGTTADSKSTPGMNTGDAGSHSTVSGNYSGSAINPTTPGATGRTVVPGDSSSQASASSGTMQERTGSTTAGNK
jgi:hypothetical protein